MNPFEFVIIIVGMGIAGQIIRTRQMGKYGIRPKGLRGMLDDLSPFGSDEDDRSVQRENDALREDVKLLKERIQTLERIAVDKENSLASEIERLRDR